MSVLVIANPVAGRRRGAQLRVLALAELGRLFPGLRVAETTAPGHGIELARSAAGSELVIAIGGDGTVREVASGLAGTGTEMAVVPVGSGNDFLKTVGVPTDVKQACAVARSGTARRFDMVRLSSLDPSTPRPLGPFLFVNAAGFGFDAAVVSEANSLKRLRGLPLYVVAVFRAVRRYECPELRITVPADAVRSRPSPDSWTQRVLLLACANGRFYGGGMKIAPDARPDDGLLEVCVADAMGRLKIVRYLPRLVAGTHVSLGEVRMLRCPRLELELTEPTLLQLDGDLQPEPVSGRFALGVLPGTLTLRV